MALGPRLDLRQGQQLVMTPQLQQAIKLLQLNNLELASFVTEELERNPLLESEEADNSSEAAPAAEDDGGEDSTPGETPADRALDLDPARDGDTEPALDADYRDNVFNNDSAADSGPSSEDASLGLNGAGAISGGGGDSDGEFSDLNDNLTENASLRDHLTAQLLLSVADPAERLIGAHLIDLVDEAGYLHGALDEVAAQLGCEEAQVLYVLTILQGFDPAGVCARSLAECLAIQQRERNRLDPAMAALLDNLPALARQDFVALRRICGVDQEDLLDMIAEIQTLNPKPGLAFGGAPAQTLVPDILVRKGQNGLWQVELNTASLPKVLLNQRYYAELADRTTAKADKTFLSECLHSANWLIKALDQRARTILRVASELVRQQEEFFEHGVQYLKPLNLKHIAEAIEMHESTVSRVTSNKYMATPRGIFELKYFFTTAIATTDGAQAHSSEAVRDRIRRLIDAETPDEILSDDRIVEILNAEQIEIARRTVAKYRESMRIPSSVQRRRMKRVAS